MKSKMFLISILSIFLLFNIGFAQTEWLIDPCADLSMSWDITGGSPGIDTRPPETRAYFHDGDGQIGGFVNHSAIYNLSEIDP